MKFARNGLPGRERPVAIDESGNLKDISGVVSDIDKNFLADEAFIRLSRMDLSRLPDAEFIRFGPCVRDVGKIVCVGLNYVDHAMESGFAVPTEPVVFLKATSALSGANDPIITPRGSAKLDWEVELGVVIGRRTQYATIDEALSAVAGYCIVNDVSERSFQLERGGQWTKGKSFDSSAPCGPWLVTADEIPDPQDLRLSLSVNGELRQSASTRDMIFGVADLIVYLSSFMTLQPGDIIATGTPPGVGMGMVPPRYLEQGDVMDIAITGLGRQRQEVHEPI